MPSIFKRNGIATESAEGEEGANGNWLRARQLRPIQNHESEIAGQ